MTRFSALIASLMLFASAPGFAQVQEDIQEIIAEGTYNMGDSETPGVAKGRALVNAKRTALEQAGTYVESFSKVKNYRLAEDEVIAVTYGMMEVEVLQEKTEVTEDNTLRFWVRIQATIKVDTPEQMAAKLKERSTIEDFKKIKGEYEKNQQAILQLKAQLAESEGALEKQQLEARISDEEESFKANEWFEKGLRSLIDFDDNQAIEELTEAISLSPDYAEAYQNRGIAYYNNDEGMRAIQDLARVVALKPGSYGAHLSQGIIYTEEKKLGKASDEFKAAIAINPEEALAYIGRGHVYEQMKRPDLKKARAYFDRAVSKGGKWLPISHTKRGGVLAQLEQFDQAIADFNAAIDLSPRNWLAYLGRGIALVLKQQYSKGLEDLNHAMDLHPNKPEAHLIRGQVYAEIGNGPRAIADFQKACDLGNTEGCEYWQILLNR